MNIIVDNKIPFLQDALTKYGQALYVKGDEISADHAAQADVLLVRTRTCCNAGLLENSAVKFIGTTTIGTDHIDLDYCRRKGIVVANAAGCNAPAVMQHVITALLTLAVKKKVALQSLTLGIVGVGNVGKRVAAAAKALGMTALLNDPPREMREGSAQFTPLHELLHRSDVVTLHLPLQHDTHNFADVSFFRALKEGAWFINTSRGEVVNEKDLVQYANKLDALALDVWRSEPHFDVNLLKYATIATPHIAGYSLQGKRKASQMVLEALAQWCDDTDPIPELIDHTSPPPVIVPEGATVQEQLYAAVQKTYPIMEMDAQMRQHPADFEALRNNYPLRNDFTAHTVASADNPALSEILKILGFRVSKA
ncbi:MAG: 4-phosphoerythronate dehydrogenase [Prevotellaceae bacterium]|jgi:erythronate-4-phosphate dehydrogenase|nr:4-phosphoerythronate dehydrogenase [Prevotellaceae bacterium]